MTSTMHEIFLKQGFALILVLHIFFIEKFETYQFAFNDLLDLLVIVVIPLASLKKFRGLVVLLSARHCKRLFAF